jgi:uncharacterized protein (DUF433 family)
VRDIPARPPWPTRRPLRLERDGAAPLVGSEEFLGAMTIRPPIPAASQEIGYPSFMYAFAPRPPPLRTDEHGVIRVADTKVSLESVVLAFDRGASAEEIVESFPTLDLGAVYGTLAYVLADRSAVDAYLATRRDCLEELRADAERRFPARDLRARLLSRRQGGVT